MRVRYQGEKLGESQEGEEEGRREEREAPTETEKEETMTDTNKDTRKEETTQNVFIAITQDRKEQTKKKGRTDVTKASLAKKGKMP